MRQRWADEGRPAPNVTNDRHRLIAAVAGGCPVDTIAAERSWCAARGIEPDGYVAAARAGQPPLRRSPGDRRRGPRRLRDDQAASRRHRRRRPAAGARPRAARPIQDFADVARWRFRHVLVDEAQDLNPVQYELLRLLVAGRNDLFLVGDPAQAIYGFNGADPSLLVDVDRHLPGVEIVRLDDEPPVARRRSSPPDMHVLGVAGQPRRRRLGSRRRASGRGPRRRRRARRGRRSSPASSPPAPRICCAAARSPCSPAPTSSWPRCGPALDGCRRRRAAPGDPGGESARRRRGTAAALRSAAQLRGLGARRARRRRRPPPRRR